MTPPLCRRCQRRPPHPHGLYCPYCAPVILARFLRSNVIRLPEKRNEK